MPCVCCSQEKDDETKSWERKATAPVSVKPGFYNLGYRVQNSTFMSKNAILNSL